MALPMNIDTLKGTIGKRTGVAKTNRFAIYMNLPIVSINPTRILSNVVSGNFNPMQILNDPRDISLLCESCSLPGRQITTTDHVTRIKTIKKTYGYLNEDVSFSFLLTGDYYIKSCFDEWQNGIINYERGTINYREDYVSNVIIQQLNEKNIPIYTCTLRNAFPTTVSSIELSNAGENQIARVNVTMSYDDWDNSASLAGAAIGALASKLLS